MTTNEFIKQLKELDPNGNLTIAFVHRDEYLTDDCYDMKVISKGDFNRRYDYFKDRFDDDEEYDPWKTWEGKKKILVICPFND
jgi:hypothetical protein